MIKNNSKIIEQSLINATVKVFVEGQFSGTGFFIASTGYILTAHHCILEGKRITIQTPYDGEKVAQLDLDKSVSAYDLAILKVDYSPSHYLPLGLITKGQVSDAVVTVGYPAGNITNNQEVGVYQGYISRWRNDDYLELSDAIKGEGHSGSLVYHYGTERVIGVVTDRYKESVMMDAGLAMKLERLFAKWTGLDRLNQATIEVWEKQLQSLKKEEIKHRIFFAILPEESQNQVLLDLLREIIEDRWGCQLMTARDRQYGDNSLDNIRRHLEQADAFIAEVSQADAEVMFILGAVQFYLSHVPLVLLAQQQPTLPQILQGRHVIQYNNTINLIQILEQEIGKKDEILQLLKDPHRDHFLPLRKLKSYSFLQELSPLMLELLQNHYPTKQTWQKFDISYLKFLGLKEELIRMVVQEFTEHNHGNSRFQEIYEQAIQLYAKGRSYDAAVIFQQAQKIAKEDQMLKESFNAEIWAAISWHESYDQVRAFNLIMDIGIYGDTYLTSIDQWRVKKRLFYLSSDYYPQLNKLQQHIEKLRQFQEDYPEIPIADLYQVIGQLLRFQGQWEESLSQYEKSWTEHIDHESHKWNTAYYASFCNLKLGKLEASQRWCDLLEKTEMDLTISRWAWWILRANISLYLGKWQKAENYTIEAEKTSQTIQFSYYKSQSFFIRVRTLLLQFEYEDPANSQHPARVRLKERFVGKPYLHTKYDRSLLVIDYRLACLRYTLGVAPVDDYWYQLPQQLPTALPSGLDLSEFQQRVKLAQRAIKRAMKQAQYLDNCFQCDWRQQEVTERQKRLEELNNVTE